MGEKYYYVAAMTALKSGNIDGTDVIGDKFKPSFSFKVVTSNASVDGNEKLYSGFQTNEAPTHFLMDKVADNTGKLFDKYIFYVTKECEDEIIDVGVLGNSKKWSTVDYVKACIKTYAEEILHNNADIRGSFEEDYDNVNDYVEDSFSDIKVENVDNKMINRLMEEMFPSDDDNDEIIHIYFDYTAGSRFAQLIQILGLGIIDNYGAKVDAVIYADLTDSKNPKICDCLQTYNAFKAREKMWSSLNSISDTLKNMGMDDIDDETVEKLQIIQDAIDDFKNKKQSYEDTMSLVITNLDEIQNISVKLALSAAAKKIKIRDGMNDFELLLDDADDVDDDNKNRELIKNFYEHIIEYLIDYNFLIPQNMGDDNKYHNLDIARGKDFLIAYQEYYFGRMNKKKIRYGGVLLKCEEYLEVLKNDINRSAKILIDEEFDLDKQCEKIDGRKLYFNHFNSKSLNALYKYQKGKKLKSISSSGFNGYGDIVKRLHVFFESSFPFMCTARGGEYYIGVDEYYKKKVTKLFEEIEKKRNEKGLTLDEYKRYIESIKIMDRIPFCPDEESNPSYLIDFNLKLFGVNNREEAKTKFLDLFSFLESIRRLRNDYAHDGHEISAEERREAASEIRDILRDLNKNLKK